ncbi:MAG TPA: SIS domain-containing protein [Caulobacteraceae bacterium]|nr:SIS domain-containing protein [Caulobacteraceae bacterium]
MSSPTVTRMWAEAAQTAEALRQGAPAREGGVRRAAALLRRRDPAFIATAARGSSDHAAAYAKYLIETRLGVPVLSQAPSVQSVYGAASPRLGAAAVLAISQSGRSPDLLETAQAAKAQGALVIALVNDATSPLADLADVTAPLAMGPETSVAATKSFLGAMATLLSLTAEWGEDARLRALADSLPATLERAWRADWSAAVAPLAHTQNLFVLGRGLTFAAALEAALKFKETCGIHAEAFSTAEVLHGPAALVGPAMPLVIFPPADAAARGLTDQIDAFRRRGALTIVAGECWGGDLELPVEAGLAPEVAPIATIQSFYGLVEAVARARGRDPDHPPHLAKVTRTL